MKFPRCNLHFLCNVILMFISLNHQMNDGMYVETVPHLYELEIWADMENITYTGDMNITFKSKSEKLEINMHHSSILTKVIVLLEDNVTITPKQQDFDYNTDLYVIYMDPKFDPSKTYQLQIQFTGQIFMNDSVGVFRGVNRRKPNAPWYLATYFHPAYAHYAFPCIDIPTQKAQFRLRLKHSKYMKALSNMPQEKTVTLNNDWVLTYFKETFELPTFALAFIIFDYDKLECISKSHNVKPTKITLWAQTETMKNIKFACDIIDKFIGKFEDKFKFFFPSSKLDVVAMPDFSHEPTENFGLIFFNERDLVFDPTEANGVDRITILERVGRKITQQWLGGVVTLKRWTDWWFYESLASYISIQKITPLPEMFQMLWHDRKQLIFDFDAYTSYPMVPYYVTPENASVHFTEVARAKGTFIFAMLENWIGSTDFDISIRSFLKQYAYLNAGSEEFWACLNRNRKFRSKDRISLPLEISVKMVADSWVHQPGYPYIVVRQNSLMGSIDFEQMRFVRSLNITTDSSACWWLPFFFTTVKDWYYFKKLEPNWAECLQDRRTVLNSMYNPGANFWIVLLKPTYGLFKVGYSSLNWTMLLRLIADTKRAFTLDIQIQLVDDVFDLASIDEATYQIAFRMLREIVAHNNAFVLMRLERHLEFLYEIFRLQPEGVHFQEYLGGLISPTLFNMSTLSTVKIQAPFADMICRYQIGDCAKYYRNNFRDWMKCYDSIENNSIPIEMREAVYCSMVAEGGDNKWTFLNKVYQTANVLVEKVRALKSLGCTNDENKLQSFLDTSLASMSVVDLKAFYLSVIKNTKYFETFKTFFMNNFKQIYDRFKYHKSVINDMLFTMSKRIKTRRAMHKWMSFWEQYEAGENQYALHTGLQISLDVIQSNLDWIYNNYEKVANILEKETLKSALITPDQQVVALESGGLSIWKSFSMVAIFILYFLRGFY